MDRLQLFNTSKLNNLLNKRSKETKFGETVKIPSKLTSIYDTISSLDVDFVLFGVPEDVGVFANHGKTGTSGSWEATLKILLNIQTNPFTRPDRVLILGSLDYSDVIEKTNLLDSDSKKDIQKARKRVEKIDRDVTHLVSTIVKSGKTPIVIGGGHNNSYGNIKGSALGIGKPINAINFDAHTDFRSEEGRHSGNGFSYAFAEGFLSRYFVFGLHENYTSQAIFQGLNKIKNVKFNTYESIAVRKELKYGKALKQGLQFIQDNAFGVEVDCDSIINTTSSAMTPSAFSVEQARQFVHFYGKEENSCYLHICEAAPTPENASQVGKLITYLITDFIRAKLL
ncbi:MAG: arginase [Bacteroidetes bacterium MedPE-SWsnd-G2]|nr:MAG: arginase [Bacteroidetes bacterium MedPE-SWsnd-G2]